MKWLHRVTAALVPVVMVAVAACGTPASTAVSGVTLTSSTTTTLDPPPETDTGTIVSSTAAPGTTATISNSTTSAPESPTAPEVPGPLAPNVSVVLDDGSTLDLNDQYHPVVLFFWATWCTSCHQMMPMIDQIATDYAGTVTIVAVARESTLPDVEKDVVEYLPSGNTRWTLDEDGTVCDAFGIPANPITVLIVGPVEADRWFGLVSDDEIRARLDEVLALYEA